MLIAVTRRDLAASLPTAKNRLTTQLIFLAVAIAAAVLAAGPAKAGIVYGNLGPSGTNALSTSTGPSLSLPVGRERGIGFIPTGPDLSLQSAVLNLQNTSLLNAATARVDLYSDVAGNPGVSLFSTSQIINANTAGLVTFTLNQTLTAGTTYWLVATKDGQNADNDLFWRSPDLTTAATAQNGSGWNSTIVAGKFTNDSGANWTDTTSTNVGFSLVAVPEPSTWALAGMGLLAGCFTRRVRAIFGR